MSQAPFFRLGKAVYRLNGAVLQKVPVGTTKQEGGATYHLNSNHRWERIDKNLGQTARKLLRNKDANRLSVIGDNIDSESYRNHNEADSSHFHNAANLLTDSQDARELKAKNGLALNPKGIKNAFKKEIEGKPSIKNLRSLALLAKRSSEAASLLNPNLADSLEDVAQEIRDEIDLRQTAKELKAGNEAPVEFVGQGLRFKSEWNIELENSSINSTNISYSPYIEPYPSSQKLKDRADIEKDPWLRQAVLLELAQSNNPEGTINYTKDHDSGAVMIQRLTKIRGSPRLKFVTISEDDLTDAEKTGLGLA